MCIRDSVTGDGAIAMIVDRFARDKIDGLEAESDAAAADEEPATA